MESLDKTRVPPASSITDSTGALWTVTASKALRNGTATSMANVLFLLYFNRIMYRRNVTGGWYRWTGSKWASTTQPKTPGSIPPSLDMYRDGTLVARGKVVPK